MSLPPQPAGIDAGKSLGQLTPAQAAERCETIKMEFPVPVLLTVDHQWKINYPCARNKDGAFQPTIHDVPVELAGHYWLKVHNVKPVPVPIAGADQEKPAKK
jgi:hypothetical protein